MIKYFLISMMAILFTVNAISNDNNKTKTDNKTVIIDNRTEAEYKVGHIEGAKLVPYDVIADKIKEVVPDKNTKIILYCRSGRRSGIALQTLNSLGYKNVENYGGMHTAKEKLGIK